MQAQSLPFSDSGGAQSDTHRRIPIVSYSSGGALRRASTLTKAVVSGVDTKVLHTHLVSYVAVD